MVKTKSEKHWGPRWNGVVKVVGVVPTKFHPNRTKMAKVCFWGGLNRGQTLYVLLFSCIPPKVTFIDIGWKLYKFAFCPRFGGWLGVWSAWGCPIFIIEEDFACQVIRALANRIKMHIFPLTINEETVEFVSEWRYLGVTLSGGNCFGFTARPDLNSFFLAVNSIVGALKGAHEYVILSLIYTNCVPILSLRLCC